MSRTAEITRKTKETDITVKLNIDGSGTPDIDTGIGFFDHMLTALCVHGGFDMTVKCRGDLNVDGHHSVEDTGITLGKAFAEALGDKSGIMRYGSSFIPMDEALGFCALDISARPFLVFNASGNSIPASPRNSCARSLSTPALPCTCAVSTARTITTSPRHCSRLSLMR